MLYILQKKLDHPMPSVPAKVRDRIDHWHIGEPVPEIKLRVVDFRADGDELQLILDAMKATSKHAG